LTHADRPFLQWEDNQALTFSEVNRQVNRLAHGLRDLNVEHGERVVLFLPNCLDYVLMWFALNKIGAIEVPINVNYRGIFLEHAINNSGARIVITASSFLPVLRDAESNLTDLVTIFLRESSEERIEFSRIDVREFTELHSDNDTNPNVDVEYLNTAAICYTSGTTGPSKGVLMSHSQIYFFSQQCVDLMKLIEDDTYINPFPMFHANAQFLTIYPCLIVGARAVLYESFSATAWISRARDCGATVTNLLGVTMEYILNQHERSNDSDNKLRAIYSSPRVHTLIPEWHRRFGNHRFVNAFGQTETSFTLMAPYDEPMPDGAVGKQVKEWFDVRLVNPDTDEEVAEGEIGELIIRPKIPWTICDGYNRNPEATTRTFRNLWWHTGDGLYKDANGWFYFIDRVNDSLRVRGENVSSFEVEQVLLQHEAISQCAAVSVPSNVSGGEHEIMACLVLNEGATLIPAELIRFCEVRAPWFAVPRYIEILDDLPKTSNGKVRKEALRKAGVTSTTWDRVESGVEVARR
jgi:crotonobetaine/carnitine-CoA ligase